MSFGRFAARVELHIFEAAICEQIWRGRWREFRALRQRDGHAAAWFTGGQR